MAIRNNERKKQGHVLIISSFRKKHHERYRLLNVSNEIKKPRLENRGFITKISFVLL
jgi:hypothetical protein